MSGFFSRNLYVKNHPQYINANSYDRQVLYYRGREVGITSKFIYQGYNFTPDVD